MRLPFCRRHPDQRTGVIIVQRPVQQGYFAVIQRLAPDGRIDNPPVIPEGHNSLFIGKHGELLQLGCVTCIGGVPAEDRVPGKGGNILPPIVIILRAVYREIAVRHIIDSSYMRNRLHIERVRLFQRMRLPGLIP
ncbi:hypothetical protein D3C73_1212940 [compost metagenome]